MPNRPKDFSVTATAPAADDFQMIDGATNGTRKLSAQHGANTRNALAPRQALVNEGVVAAGATFTIPAFGSSDFTVSVVAKYPSGLGNTTLVGGAGTASFEMTTDSSSSMRPFVFSKNVGVVLQATTAVVANKWTLITYTRASGVGTFYLNGIASGTGTDATNYSNPSTKFAMDGGVHVFPLIYNRALSATEVVTLYEAGAPASADYNTASNTANYTSDFSVNNDGWSQESGTGAMVGNVDAIGGLDNWLQATQGASAGPLGGYNTTKLPQQGRYYRITGKIRHDSATVTSYRVYIYLQSSPALNGQTAIAVPANTTVSFDFLFPYPVNSSTPLFIIKGEQNFAPGEHSWIRELNVYNLGLLLAPESNASGSGRQWRDVSGAVPPATIVLPASGVSWALPGTGDVSYVQRTLTANGELLDTAGVLHTDAVLVDVVVKNTTANAVTAFGIGMSSGVRNLTYETNIPANSTVILPINRSDLAGLTVGTAPYGRVYYSAASWNSGSLNLSIRYRRERDL
jgi:hypothetical protein